MDNGKWIMDNGEWIMENGKWRILRYFQGGREGGRE